MFRLYDLYARIIKKPLPSDCGLACEYIDAQMSKLNRLLTDTVSFFSYTLVLSGRQTLVYNNMEIRLSAHDIFITTPGMRIYTKDVSDDYSSICLMGEEATTYEIPHARNVVAASYFPIGLHSDNKLTLNPDEAAWLTRRLEDVHAYIGSNHIYKRECLYSLYSLFILDLLDVESRRNTGGRVVGGHAADLFLKFMKLLADNFLKHHEIAFYADTLAITTVYLSRVVRRFSGQTVKAHIDRLLLMEATYLLATTDAPMAEIAERLGFANSSVFCKFFARHKGMPPRIYRSQGPFSF